MAVDKLLRAYIHMYNLSLHSNDYEDKSEKKMLFILKYKYCYAQVLKAGV